MSRLKGVGPLPHALLPGHTFECEQCRRESGLTASSQAALTCEEGNQATSPTASFNSRARESDPHLLTSSAADGIVSDREVWDVEFVQSSKRSLRLRGGRQEAAWSFLRLVTPGG